MRQAGTGAAGETGLTLIELVVALAVFALIAIMGLQGLTGALRLHDDLASRAGRGAGLLQVAGLLRNDLSAVAPLLYFPPGEGRPHPALREMPGGGFALSVAGLPMLSGLAPGDPGLRRVEWRFDAATGRLTRRLWPTLYPVGADQAGPEALVLENLRGLEVRSYWPVRGWVPGLADLDPTRPPGPSVDGDSTGAAPEIYSDRLPRAVEITLDTAAHGEITVTEFLQ